MRLFVFFICILICSCHHSQNCSSVRTGKFTNKRKDTIITRTIDYQTEVNDKNKHSWKWRIQWLNDCEYNMYLEKDDSKGTDDIFSIGDTINIKILEIHNSSYDWEATYKNHQLQGFNYILD
jgi:hypothetical protein